MQDKVYTDKTYLNFIKVVSVLIPVAVAVLIYLPGKLALGDWVKGLPAFNAVVNSLTAVLLISALIAVKNGHVKIHKQVMTTALILGVVFLLSYVLYHASVPSVKFGDLNHDGLLSNLELQQIQGSRTIYLSVLLSHIGLSIVVVPFVLFSFYFSLTGQIDRHKKVVKFSFPIWLYVSITGVVVYLMINPYYA